MLIFVKDNWQHFWNCAIALREVNSIGNSFRHVSPWIIQFYDVRILVCLNGSFLLPPSVETLNEGERVRGAMCKEFMGFFVGDSVWLRELELHLCLCWERRRRPLLNIFFFFFNMWLLICLFGYGQFVLEGWMGEQLMLVCWYWM